MSVRLFAHSENFCRVTCVTPQRKSFKRRSVLLHVPTQLERPLSHKPVRSSICREGSVCLLRPHSTRTRSSLQTLLHFPANGSAALFLKNQFAGKEASACCVPTQQGHAPPCKPTGPYRADCAATQYGLSFQGARKPYELALTTSANRSTPRRSSRRSTCFSGVIRPIDSNNHTVATKAIASRANTPW